MNYGIGIVLIVLLLLMVFMMGMTVGTLLEGSRYAGKYEVCKNDLVECQVDLDVCKGINENMN